MRKEILDKAVSLAKAETRAALQLVYDELNHGQQRKLLKSEEVRKLFDRYNVTYNV